MPIESVSYPADLAEWDSGVTPFYLEVFGETSPEIDSHYAEVIPAGNSSKATAQTGGEAPVYEYWWTIGHPGLPHNRPGRWTGLFGSPDASSAAAELWTNLQDDPAARVYLFFPVTGGWRIKELTATVKYLSPVPKQESLWEKAAQEWKVLSPLVQDASTLAGALGPEVGVPVHGAVKTLDALAKLKITSLPQGNGFDWSVGKVTFGHKDEDPRRSGVMQGVVWELPKAMFTELGGRLTGSLAVSFIPCRTQQTREGQIEGRDLLAHAVVYGPEDEIWAPGKQQFIHLSLNPVTKEG